MMIGGLVGISDSAITDCYATGKVVGRKYVGELLGMGNALIVMLRGESRVSNMWED